MSWEVILKQAEETDIAYPECYSDEAHNPCLVSVSFSTYAFPPSMPSLEHFQLPMER